MYHVTLPLLVYVSKNTTFKLNLNDYRNTHYQKLNNAKIAFVDVTKRDVLHLPKMQAAEIHYKLFLKGGGKKGDVANFCCIADKFFCDALVEANRLPEDHYEHIPEVRYKFGGLDMNNPRIEATIHPIGDLLPESEEDTMQIILTENEIKQAIEEFVFKSMNVNEDKAIDIDIKATRGADGTTAVIDIVDRDGQTEEKAEPVKTAQDAKPVTTGKKKPGPKPKAEKVETEAEPEKEEAQEQEAPQPDFAEESEETSAPDATEAVAEDPNEGEDEQEAQPEEAPESEGEPGKPEESAEEEKAAPAAPKKSLFGGLTKPRND